MPTIPPSELKRRVEELRRWLSEASVEAAYISNPVNIFYLTNLAFIQTERPLSLIVPVDGQITLILPSVERGHAEYRNSRWGGIVESFMYYFDYPGETHVANFIADAISRLGVKGVALDNAMGATGVYGYQGPALGELLKARGIGVKDLGDYFAKKRLIKSNDEISLLEESGRWASRAIDVARELIRPGKWDWEAALEANLEISREMNKYYSPYVPLRGAVGWAVGFRGQVGEYSAFPHALVSERPFREGDVIGIGAGPEIGGYSAELERTLLLGGSPKPQVASLFNAMLELRRAALETIRAGVKASDVDRAVRRRAKELGVADLLLHHVGHGIGLEEHEPPFLDVGYDITLSENMVVSVEPGIYANGLGGFRHSDTVLVTKDGYRLLTHYPEDLESLTIEVRS